MAPLRVALLGAGTVGREVALALLHPSPALAGEAGARFELAGVAVRDVPRAVASGIPEHLVTDAPAHLVASPETDVVVELMGGDEPAHTLIAAALAAGKPVVTANKHVIAHHGPELEAVARRARSTLRFEAAVGGGMPILGTLAAELAANRIATVRGIVNGTTNYILSAMAAEGRAYDAVLADAQAAGYAEADPRGDVEGHDAANKLVILARLAFGRWLDPGSIALAVHRSGGPARPGITGVTASDVAAATAAGFALKLVASASATEEGIRAGVLPTAIASHLPLAQTAGVLNRVEVQGDRVGAIAVSGPGAGGAATSSAVLADLLAVARDGGSTWAGRPEAPGPEPALAPAAGETFAAPSGAQYPVLM